MAFWLRDRSGLRIPIGPEGLLIGRDAACAIALDDPTISRRHALIVATTGTPRLVALRKHALTVNGRVPDDEHALRAGDVVALAGASFEVGEEADAGEPSWALEHEGRRYALRTSPFVVGGGKDDDLVVERWPPRAAILHVVTDGVVLESSAGVRAGGLPADGEPRSLADRDVLTLDGVRLRLCASSSPAGTTLSPARRFASAAHLEFMPSGGLLRLTWGSERAVWLPDRRCALVATLLVQQAEAPGEFTADELIFARVWPGETATRLLLNSLVYRLRQTLVAAGIDGAALIERAPGGGGTRLRLERDAKTSVK